MCIIPLRQPQPYPGDTPTEVLPALVLAYDYYEDANREADIVARNGIRHPGFVPVEPLRVITR